MTVLMTHYRRTAPNLKKGENLFPDVPQEILSRVTTENLRVERVKLDYDHFLKRLSQVGKTKKEDGDRWHLRSEHVDMNKVNRTRLRLQSSKSSLWLFMKGDEEIGFCCAVKGGFNGQSEKYMRAEDNGTEIYKIALYDEYTRQGYGRIFVPTVATNLFNGASRDTEKDLKKVHSSDLIYLNTRDSNYVDSGPFYNTLGFEVAGEETFLELGSGNSQLTHKLVPKQPARL